MGVPRLVAVSDGTACTKQWHTALHARRQPRAPTRLRARSSFHWPSSQKVGHFSGEAGGGKSHLMETISVTCHENRAETSHDRLLVLALETGSETPVIMRTRRRPWQVAWRYAAEYNGRLPPTVRSHVKTAR
jgi:hypothetical protein